MKYTLAACAWCKLLYLPVDWIQHRTRGFCADKCTPEAREKERLKRLKKLAQP